MNLLRFNPELQRCLWLELSPRRLVVMPVILCIGFLGLDYAQAGSITPWATAVLVALLGLWGTRQAADGFAEEVAEGTWDIQRLSAANAWSLAMGKLVGSTAYVWYGALICLPFILGPKAMVTTAVLLLSGALAQSVALLCVILVHRFEGTGRRSATAFAQILGMAAGGAAVAIALKAPALVQGALTLRWYGLEIGTTLFATIVLVTLVGWSLLGLAQTVGQELGHPATPLPVSLFTLFYIVLCCGLAPPTNFAFLLWIGAKVAGVVATIAALAHPFATIDLRRFTGAIECRDWRVAWTNLPAWVPPAFLSVILDVALIASPAPLSIAGIAPAVLIRDLALVCAVRLGVRQRSTLVLGVLVLLLYGLLPPVLNVVGGPEWRATALPINGVIVHSAGPLIFVAAQTTVALALAWMVWRRRFGR
ncbi:MAG: hypothetical protein HY985_16995 [Magnetospirillum sp.]|nr:hypothetical protein [Magnetospirillum sp.]